MILLHREGISLETCERQGSRKTDATYFFRSIASETHSVVEALTNMMVVGLQPSTTTRAIIPTSRTLATNLDYAHVQVDGGINALQARAHSNDEELTTLHTVTTITSTATFTSRSTVTLSNGETSVIVTSTGTRTLVSKTAIGTSSVEHTGTQNDGSSANQTKAIIGGVTGATSIIILGLVVFFILRRRRRHNVILSAATHENSTSSSILGQGVMPQPAQSSTTPRPFLDFPVMQNCSPSTGIITNRAKPLLTQNNQGDIEQAADPFKDPVSVAEGLTDNADESQRVRDALGILQALTSRFEGELQKLGALIQSGQLSSEDHLKLEEIRRTTGLTIQFDSRHDRFSIVRSVSSGSGSSSYLPPPSYHSRGS